MKLLHALFTALAFCSLAACGGGGGDGGGPAPAPQMATFAFRIEGHGAEEEFRYTTNSQAFIDKARAQLSLPVANRRLFPAGEITGGDGGVNPGWGWHFVEADLVESATAVCNVLPSYIQQDLPNYLRSVHRFCPWGGYVHAELTNAQPVVGLAIGQPQAVPATDLRIELRDVADSRCPAAAVCVSAGEASVDVLVHRGDQQQALTLRLVGPASDTFGTAFGYRFSLEKLEPYPQTGPYPKEQYRAVVGVVKI